MQSFKIHILEGAEQRDTVCAENSSILDALRDFGVTGIHAPCGGNGTCKQCSVTITGKVKSTKTGEIIDAVAEELLSCCHTPMSDCEVILPENHAATVLTTGATDIAPCGEGLGIAIDIGTTTVAVYLYDLKTGVKLDVESDRNAQRPFGADVISRIQVSAEENGLAKLHKAIANQISTSIDKCCKRTKRSRADIERISIAGNTVMEHILKNLSPVSIGVAPFKTLSLFGDTTQASEFFDGLAEGATLYLCPALAGYVGGDITAGIYSSGAWESESACLFIDIGTNGEMGIGDHSGYTCCATAAGPAFEGAEIECGMDGSQGAISKVWYENGEIEYSVIGDVSPTGICGSGLVDALYVMLLCGAVQENGRMSSPDEVPEHIRHRIKDCGDGKFVFQLSEKVFVSGADIRQLQMAKSAIRAGIETIMKARSYKYDDVNSVVIAGGFGAFMDVRSACGIGLLPPQFVNKTRHAGNTAGAGAALTLDYNKCETLSDITAKCEYLELSSNDDFMEKYIEFMVFDEAEEV